MVTQQIRKAGNSYVVTIPKSEMERLDLEEGDFVSLELGKMELKPVLSPEVQSFVDSDMPVLSDMLNYLKDR